MSIKPHGLEPIPEETRLLVQRLCPKGTMVTQLHDVLGPIYSDEHFAQRVLAAQAQDLILAPILQVCRERGWLKPRGKQRTDATAVLARVRALNSLESVGESMRAALDAVASQEPEWLQAHLHPEWFERSVHRFELARFPKAETQRQLLREQVGTDVAQLLACIDE